MKIKKCPTCRKPGFITFRYVKKLNRKYAYVGHYDSKKYQKEKLEYDTRKRKSKPSGRVWHSISTYHVVMGIREFEGRWFEEYIQIIEKIYRKYKKYGFRDTQYVIEKARLPYYLKEIRQEFIANTNWKKEWIHAEQMLQDNGLEKQFIHQRVFHDIWIQQEYHGLNPWNDKILHSICLD